MSTISNNKCGSGGVLLMMIMFMIFVGLLSVSYKQAIRVVTTSTEICIIIHTQPEVEYSPANGDVNSDGRISATDLVFMKRHLIGIYDMNSAQIAWGDMNGNGRIDEQDIEAVIKIILKEE